MHSTTEMGHGCLSSVAGMFDVAEGSAEVATRELAEEAGLKAIRLIYATSYY